MNHPWKRYIANTLLSAVIITALVAGVQEDFSQRAG